MPCGSGIKPKQMGDPYCVRFSHSQIQFLQNGTQHVALTLHVLLVLPTGKPSGL